MVATTKFKARKALLECLRDEPGLTGVPIDYTHLGEPSESVSLGPTVETDQTDIRSMAALPAKQTETYEVTVILFVGSKATVERNEERADELLEHIMTVVATSPRLGLEAYGLQWVRVTDIAIVSGEVADEGPQTRVDIRIECKGRI